MKRRSFFQRVLGAFGAAVVADKVVAKNETSAVKKGFFVGQISITPSPTPSVTPTLSIRGLTPWPSTTPTTTPSPWQHPWDYPYQPSDGQIVFYNQFTKKFVSVYEYGVIPIVKRADGFYSYITDIKLDL